MDSRGARIAALGLQLLEKQKLASTPSFTYQNEVGFEETNNALDQYRSDIMMAEIVIDNQEDMMNNYNKNAILIEEIDVDNFDINATDGEEEALDHIDDEEPGQEEALDHIDDEETGQEEALDHIDDEHPGQEEVLDHIDDEETGQEEALDHIDDEEPGQEEALDHIDDEEPGQEEALDHIDDEETGQEEALDHIDDENPGQEEVLDHIEDEEDIGVEEGVELTKNGLPRKRRRRSALTLLERDNAKVEAAKLKHPVHPPCEKCKKNCCDKIPQGQRVELNAQFWSKPWMERRLFILNMCTKLPVMRRTAGEVTNRKNSFKYKLKGGNNVPQDVCKTFFLTTLGFTKNNDTVLHNILCKTPSTSSFPKEDKRGKRPRISETNERAIIAQHVESFKPSVSHYRRVHAPNKRYLPSDITKTLMHSDFLVKHPAVTCSYERYRSVLKQMNISFTKLGHEECEQCEYFAQHNPAHKKESLDPSCVNCCQWEKHINKAREARIKYRQHAEGQYDILHKVVFSADLQKVIMLPRMESFKSVVFTRRIIAFNESFVPVGGKNQNGLKPLAVIWHEGVAGRKKEDIVSAFHAFFLKNRDVEHIVLWLDNCSAQNKNWALLTYFVFLLNSQLVELQSLEVNYFEPGHTFMSADSFHHQVEVSMGKKGKLYDFDDFKECVQACNLGKVDVKAMEPRDFSEWKDHCSQYKLNKQTPRPMLSDVVQIIAVRGNKILQFRDAYDGPLKDLNFLTAKEFKFGITEPMSRVNYRGIPREKKDDIISKLVQLMPENRKKFWHEIPVTDSVLDLIDNIDE